jgi:hypothetical protein
VSAGGSILAPTDAGDVASIGFEGGVQGVVSHQTVVFGLFQGLEDAGVPFVVEPRLVRGLDYYSHTVFEFVVSSGGGGEAGEGKGEGGGAGHLGAVLAGGRYDRIRYDYTNNLTPSSTTGAPSERRSFRRNPRRAGKSATWLSDP